MAAAFEGKWKLHTQENFDDYMKAIGVGMANRMLAKSATPTTEFSISGDTWTMTSKGLKDTTFVFKLGQEVEETTVDGRKVKSTYTLDGNKLVQKETWDGKSATYVREIVGDELIATINIGDVKCVRKSKRV